MLQHACPLSTLVDEVLTQEKKDELMRSTNLGVRKLTALVADEVLKLVQTKCGIGLLGTPTARPAKRQVVAGSSTRSGCTNLAAQESSNPSGSITTSSWDCVGQT